MNWGRRQLVCSFAALAAGPTLVGGAGPGGESLDVGALTLLFHDDFSRFEPYDPRTNPGGHWATAGVRAFDGSLRGLDGRVLSLAEIDGDRRLCLAHRAPRHSGELALYSDDKLGPELVTSSAENGVLAMIAKAVPPSARDRTCGRAYVAPRIWLTEGGRPRAFRYGYFEARIRFEIDVGSHGAFWLFPASGRWSSEIDVVEYLGQWSRRGPVQDQYHTATHTDFGRNDAGERIRGRPVNEHWRRFGVLWTAETLTFFLDRQPVRTLPNVGMHDAMYPILNLALGSRWAMQRRGGGGPPDPASLPHRMLVDEVLIAGLAT